jgi:hypothetical protein
MSKEFCIGMIAGGLITWLPVFISFVIKHVRIV